ncbi:transcriptional regulator, partial [Acinetobacter baumannii]
LRSHCGLKGILDQALESFYQSLDQHTLGEVLQQPKTASDTSPISFLQI